MAPEQFHGDFGQLKLARNPIWKISSAHRAGLSYYCTENSKKFQFYRNIELSSEHFPSVFSPPKAPQSFVFLFVLSAFISLVLTGSGKAGAVALG